MPLRPMPNMPVHSITRRQFPNTSRKAISEIGASFGNSFYDPRNIGNFQNGEISIQGDYLDRYPTNVGSNTAGFTLIDDMGDDKNLYQGRRTAGLNAFAKSKEIYTGGGSGGANASASDYLYNNPAYTSTLHPKTRDEFQKLAEPLFTTLKYTRAQNVSDMNGGGTNAPSNADSWAGYHLNNPYAVASNFNGFTGGGVGPSNASTSDYYSSDPYRTAEIQREPIPSLQVPMKGGSVDWETFVSTVSKALPLARPVVLGLIGIQRARAENAKKDRAKYVADAKRKNPQYVDSEDEDYNEHVDKLTDKIDTALKVSQALGCLEKIRGEGKKRKTKSKVIQEAEKELLAVGGCYPIVTDKKKLAMIERGRKLLASMKK